MRMAESWSWVSQIAVKKKGALARKEKKFALCVNWEINATGGLGGTVSPSDGSVGDQWEKPLENLQYLA